MAEETKYNMHFTKPDVGRGQVVGPISYTANGARMNFELVKERMDRVLGQGNYIVLSILMRPWYKTFIMTFHLTAVFLSSGLPISVKTRIYCRGAAEQFNSISENDNRA